jgi:hypothetical protein
MRVIVEGKPYNVPDDATPDEIDEIVSMGSASAPAPAPTSAAPEMMEPPAPRQPTGPLQVAGEFANAANRSFLEGLDYVGPGAINAGLRLAGSDYQVPTFTGMFEENVPGAQGGFMPEGTERDVVRGAGSALPVAAAMKSVAGRNLASVPGAAADWFGFGSSAPAADAVSQVSEMLRPNAARTPVEIADQVNYPLTPGERTGSKSLKLLESAIDSTPMPFNPMHRIARQQQQRVNEAASSAIGRPGRTLPQETMGDVADELSGEFKRLELEDDLLVNEKFHQDLADVEASARTRLFKDPELTNTVDDIMDRIDETGALGAVDYQNITSQLKGKIRQSFAGQSPDPEFADSLSQIVTALDDLAEDQLDGAALARLREARRKWRTFSSLEKSGAVTESGDVSGRKLANYLKRTDKSGYARGKNDAELYDVARSSKAFPPRPDSGTAGRMLMQSLVAGGGVGSGFTGDILPILAAMGLPLGASALANTYAAGMPLALRAAGAGGQIARRAAQSPGMINATRGYLEDQD